jgi:hypothetical protein
VLLASAGHLDHARQLLMGSAAMSPQPVIWRNLAVVHARLGERQLAEQAQQRAQALAQSQGETKGPHVEWVDPATFASTAPATDTLVPTTTATPSTAPAATPTAAPAAASEPAGRPASVATQRPTEWNPNNLRR